jgi:AraC-like DNA-binding protein
VPSMTDARAAAFRPRTLLVLDVPSLAAFRSVDAPFRAQVLGWDDLAAAAQTASPSSIVLLDPGGTGEADPRVRTLIETAPMLPVVAVLPFRDAGTIRRLMEWGVSEVADPSFEGSPAGIAPLLQRAHAAPFKRRIEAALPRFLSLNALTLVRAAAATTVDHGGAAELAEVFGCGERTVAGWCAREGLPAPRRLMAWLRALLAVALLEEPHRSVLNASQCAGYASDHPLRRSLRELLPEHESRSPRAIRFDELTAVLTDELRTLREVSRKLRLRQHTA